MLALALFFVLIISLLLLVVWMLQKYFDMYSRLHISENNAAKEIPTYLKRQELVNQAIEKEKEVNNLIVERLSKLEADIPKEKMSAEVLEIFSGNFKKLIRSSLTVLKTTSNRVKP